MLASEYLLKAYCIPYQCTKGPSYQCLPYTNACDGKYLQSVHTFKGCKGPLIKNFYRGKSRVPPTQSTKSSMSFSSRCFSRRQTDVRINTERNIRTYKLVFLLEQPSGLTPTTGCTVHKMGLILRTIERIYQRCNYLQPVSLCSRWLHRQVKGTEKIARA